MPEKAPLDAQDLLRALEDLDLVTEGVLLKINSPYFQLRKILRSVARFPKTDQAQVDVMRFIGMSEPVTDPTVTGLNRLVTALVRQQKMEVHDATNAVHAALKEIIKDFQRFMGGHGSQPGTDTEWLDDEFGPAQMQGGGASFRDYPQDDFRF